MFDVIRQNDPEWSRVTRFIHDTYRRAYNAEVDTFMPQIMRVTNAAGEYRAVMGYRAAGQERLFLENYLDDPIEVSISRYLGQTVERSTIVEVGNLAEANPGDARLAIIAATAYMWARGYRWVAFTGVTRMRNVFRKLGLDTRELMAADESRLPPEEVAKWGAYYQGNPVVCFADIKHGHDNLQDLWASLRDTWAAAEEAGLKAAGEMQEAESPIAAAGEAPLLPV
ncbi:MAG: hypothetical protein COW18_12430 [Zetaproteobacteria bacterium CG12_big_fil_rev_8_21_14_0_65_54_13]|nr:MAG: hypothetical protein COX55_08195 [Zetaproteobacteria bacterium CG23_combo_of_CG06-09_8_20_14_all_54_7]PIW44825.1 MAG: hypothetical protein COW18_12430 [Zetaproteobacteria bacterium CG12_big_fil_rev_8_21_14_0_65_54_13]PIX55655.1 MAG: hypothetical protein COZ50_01675 [Zetaproteobacteria bacterium CG_4_10_14_3_um_filter_54_28]PJA30663.1 MAG: hypothetical protein CO188_02565 [Zetaproteobacteria bacterium CG_4_9_14_3_um_filter_54_145]